MPQVLAFDVNETLSDMSSLGRRLEEVGAPHHLLATWFAGVLRDGVALAAAGGYASFTDVAAGTLRALLATVDTLAVAAEDAVGHVLAGLDELPVHGDVAPALERLHAVGLRLVTLSNGSASYAERLLRRGGAAQYVEQFLSVDDVRRWKPAPEAYRHAADRCGVRPQDLMLVGVHPWDTDGAMRAGLAAAWIDRHGGGEGPFPDFFRRPDAVSASLTRLAERITGSPL
jgi:2-haloacid dehalogenase